MSLKNGTLMDKKAAALINRNDIVNQEIQRLKPQFLIFMKLLHTAFYVNMLIKWVLYSLNDEPNTCIVIIMTSINVVRAQLSCNDVIFFPLGAICKIIIWVSNDTIKKCLRYITAWTDYISFFGRMHHQRFKQMCLHQPHWR